jgi:hypothetical protein
MDFRINGFDRDSLGAAILAGLFLLWLIAVLHRKEE